MNAHELTALLPSWEITLQAERKTPDTIRAYLDGAKPYLAWCVERPKLDPLSTKTLNGWTASLLAAGRKPQTAKTRLHGVQRFTSWLAREGEIDADPFYRVTPPKVDEE